MHGYIIIKKSHNNLFQVPCKLWRRKNPMTVARYSSYLLLVVTQVLQSSTKYKKWSRYVLFLIHIPTHRFRRSSRSRWSFGKYKDIYIGRYLKKIDKDHYSVINPAWPRNNSTVFGLLHWQLVSELICLQQWASKICLARSNSYTRISLVMFIDIWFKDVWPPAKSKSFHIIAQVIFMRREIKRNSPVDADQRPIHINLHSHS